MINVKNKHIVVVGAARSGVAVAKLLHAKEAEVFVTDHQSIERSFKKQLKESDIRYEENGHTRKAENFDFAVVSPGVPTTAPLVQKYLKAGKDVFSELEVASWFNRGPIIAVTGSNGKTTVVNWLDHIWKTAGKNHLTGGNIGDAFSEKVIESTPEKDTLLEVSSFQLDHIKTFHPHVSVLLNITPDHLDRYDNSFEKYAAAKFRIFENQTADDWIIYHRDDPVINPEMQSLRNRKEAPGMLAFSSTEEVQQGAFVHDQTIKIKLNNKEEQLMPISEVRLNGTHNLNNGLAAALAARASEISNEAIRESMRTFEGVEHRLEEVRTIDGVKYINDSKATNINAVWYALDSFDVPMALILGGRDKGNDYNQLAGQIREKVHTIIAIGEARPLIEKQLKMVVPHFETAETMEEAVKKGKNCTKRGEIVLLSPACASFDMYKNYEHRGNEFKQIVNNL
ncbi:MAG TPA: UDP-N-acetylmuramoyl-L-alanine--D-glutamate ligase [Balneolaceae bacterium]|nr:UDP-N-acetylmuramoyl-L-alanine--D-glutamate ligase [Balneolaceae bacterium]